MKTKFLLLLCVFVLAITFEISSKSVVFKFVIPKVNSKWIEFYQTDMSIKVNATSDSSESSKYEARNFKLIKKELIVLETNENGVKKIKVTYKKTETINYDNGTETKTSELPVLNKTYIIEKNEVQGESDAVFNISYEDGTLPTTEEISFILKEDYEKKSDLDYNSDELKDKSIEIGQKVDYFNSLFEDLIGTLNSDTENNTEKNKEYSVALKSVKKNNGTDCGVFELNFKLSYKDPQSGMTITLNLTGEIYIAVNTSQIMKFSMKGPMLMDGEVKNEQGTMIVKGDGIINYQYDQPLK